MSKPSESAGKLTQREYAAIHLAVPESGTEWLDEMIRKSPQYRDQQASVEQAPKPARKTAKTKTE
jgi:23S rRNA-/tRNA-specific pseudouridylate synthase